MRLRLLVMLLSLVGAWALYQSLDDDGPKNEPSVLQVAKEVPSSVDTGRGRQAESVEQKWIDLARSFMGNAQEGTVGPYRWIGDVRDQRLLVAFDRLAGQLDSVYEKQLGLKPIGKPAETLFIFGDLKDFRRFVDSDPWVSGIYAGYASAARGFMALYVGDQKTETVLSTFAHELAHLVHRRTLGSDLPPWLSEGLADAIGDSATEVGFRPIAKKAGDGVQASRLRSARNQQRERSLSRLFTLKRDEFDQGVVVDYEQSALMVRFLLTQPTWKAWFQSCLQRIAGGEDVDWEVWVGEVGGRKKLEDAFYAWLSSS